MTMRVTGRDNRAAGGGVNNDTMVLNVTSAAGPFLVTSPNTATTWTGGSSQTVTWNVANTSAAPVNCANVKISLSINNGATFPIVLAASTPNDGSASITVPNLPTFNARIKVQAVGNVFFDISNTVFTIAAGAPGGSRAQFDLDGDGKSDIGSTETGSGEFSSPLSRSTLAARSFSVGAGAGSNRWWPTSTAMADAT
jgi:hypothetical protein